MKKPIDQNMDKLKIGDRIYTINEDGYIVKIITITRVTKTLAISDSKEINDDYHNYERFRVIDKSIHRVSQFFTLMTYELESHRLERRFSNQQLRAKISAINWNEIDIETIEEILELLPK